MYLGLYPCYDTNLRPTSLHVEQLAIRTALLGSDFAIFTSVKKITNGVFFKKLEQSVFRN